MIHNCEVCGKKENIFMQSPNWPNLDPDTKNALGYDLEQTEHHRRSKVHYS